MQLPHRHIERLTTSALEGSLSVDLGWYQLWPADEIDELNQGYHVNEFWPDYFAFGSNGGGEMFAYDKDMRVVMIPFISDDPEEIVTLANSWDVFETFIESGS